MSNSPYSEPGSIPPAPPRPDNTLKIVLIIVGGLLLMVMLVCGGIMTAGYFVFQKASETISEAMSGSLADRYLENAESREALGEVVSTEIDFDSMSSDEENASLEVRVIGTKGKGTLIIGTDEDGTENVQLVMDDGRIIDLPPPVHQFEEEEVLLEEIGPLAPTEDSAEMLEPIEN
ncbi:hypothetical protein FF011L_16040 [Roseimaritima multifibrata]|uniref:Cytochrome oxidase complex assembly protein 1 n=1 Tax=Roseimaritima multifibrata TaxID=1930274 RepID=A0A517MD95_9BACT|nr:cytochrome c oxidase assembly factor Coa1 family protein [Roseimaritima multifibrata]QDS92855.1 hypothetical protein FF011L_16040 [Roseimaritima multifibrata]